MTTSTTSSTGDARKVTMHGSPLTLVGDPVVVGSKAPAFSLTTSELKPLTLDDALAGGTRTALLVVVPSLDTQVCSVETQTFHKRLSELPDGAAAFIVSRDLPFAMARWATENDASRLNYLSDYRDHAFGRDYGVGIEEIALLARSIFVIDKTGTVTHASIVPEIADEPNYDDVFAAVKAAV